MVFLGTACEGIGGYLGGGELGFGDRLTGLTAIRATGVSGLCGMGFPWGRTGDPLGWHSEPCGGLFFMDNGYI